MLKKTKALQLAQSSHQTITRCLSLSWPDLSRDNFFFFGTSHQLIIHSHLELPNTHRKKRQHFSLIFRNRTRTIGLKGGLKKSTYLVTSLLYKSPSQIFAASSSLNFIVVQLWVKRSLSLILRISNLFRIFAPKFSVTFRRTAAEFLRFVTRAMIILYNTIIYNYEFLKRRSRNTISHFTTVKICKSYNKKK